MAQPGMAGSGFGAQPMGSMQPGMQPGMQQMGGMQPMGGFGMAAQPRPGFGMAAQQPMGGFPQQQMANPQDPFGPVPGAQVRLSWL